MNPSMAGARQQARIPTHRSGPEEIRSRPFQLKIDRLPLFSLRDMKPNACADAAPETETAGEYAIAFDVHLAEWGTGRERSSVTLRKIDFAIERHI